MLEKRILRMLTIFVFVNCATFCVVFVPTEIYVYDKM